MLDISITKLNENVVRQFKDLIKMNKIIRILCLLLLTQTTFGQTEIVDKIPMFSGSLTKDSYIESVDLKRNYIDSLIYRHKEQIRVDTIPFKIIYTIKKEDNTYILQNPYSPYENIDNSVKNINSQNSDSIKVIVTTSGNRILKIQLPSPYFSIDLFGNRIDHFNNYHNFYFENNELIFSGYGCSDPSAFIGSCGGANSEYSNYFKSGKYYNTSIDGKTYYCGCGINLIVNNSVIDELIATILNRIK
jgi:hypothetical protein